MSRDLSISVIGLGKLGVCVAACLASTGFRVVGVDVNEQTVAAINGGRAPVFEPGLPELLRSVGGRLTGTTDAMAATMDSSVTFIVVPTPSEADGRFSLRYVLQACEAVAHALAMKDAYHTVVVTSTVMPGDMDREIKPLMEAVSGTRCGEGFGLCYSPEFIALGSVIRDFTNPDIVLIGESDPMAGSSLEEIYLRTCQNSPPIQRMSFINAELAKLAVNTYVTTKISFANMLASMCEHLEGADVDVVTQTLGLDPRIGPRYLKGAAPYGGPCFPRDNVALAALARSINARSDLAEATDALNRARLQELVQMIAGHLPDQGRVGVLGLSYKPDTNVVEESPGLMLALELAERGLAVTVHDPSAMDAAARAFGRHADRIAIARTAEACIAASDVVVLMTPWREYKELGRGAFSHGRPQVIIDCWRTIQETQSLPPGVRYVAIGIGPSVKSAHSNSGEDTLTPAPLSHAPRGSAGSAPTR